MVTEETADAEATWIIEAMTHETEMTTGAQVMSEREITIDRFGPPGG